MAAVAPYTDFLEIAWLNECTTKTFAELADAGSPRMRRLDLVLSKCLATVIHKSGEVLSEDVFLADREAADTNHLLGG